MACCFPLDRKSFSIHRDLFEDLFGVLGKSASAGLITGDAKYFLEARLLREFATSGGTVGEISAHASSRCQTKASMSRTSRSDSNSLSPTSTVSIADDPQPAPAAEDVTLTQNYTGSRLSTQSDCPLAAHDAEERKLSRSLQLSCNDLPELPYTLSPIASPSPSLEPHGYSRHDDDSSVLSLDPDPFRYIPPKAFQTNATV